MILGGSAGLAVGSPSTSSTQALTSDAELVVDWTLLAVIVLPSIMVLLVESVGSTNETEPAVPMIDVSLSVAPGSNSIFEAFVSVESVIDWITLVLSAFPFKTMLSAESLIELSLLESVDVKVIEACLTSVPTVFAADWMMDSDDVVNLSASMRTSDLMPVVNWTDACFVPKTELGLDLKVESVRIDDEVILTRGSSVDDGLA